MKSPRSAVLLIAAWMAAKLRASIRCDAGKLSKLLRGWDVIDADERLLGFLVYRPCDPRGRIYAIVLGERHALFAKAGTDVPDEQLDAESVRRLAGAGFIPQLPMARMRDGAEWFNLYQYLHPACHRKVRLTANETRTFVAALNGTAPTQTQSLVHVLAGAPPHPRGARTLAAPRAQALLRRMASYPVALGRIHGDLMSPNMLARAEGQSTIILDWERYETKGPLLLDLVGGLNWSEVEERARSALNNGSTADPTLAFMLIAAARGFTPAIDWLNAGSPSSEAQ